jgi:aryl-alcohol dehydrogenase-like predicted oxidoreductase
MLSTWTPPSLEQQKHQWDGMVPAPTPGTLTMQEAMFYSLSKPLSTVIIGCNTIQQLEENVQLAREFTPLSETQQGELEARAESVAKPSLFFRFYDRP